MLVDTRDNSSNPKKVDFFHSLLDPSAPFGGLYTLDSIPKIDFSSIINFSYNELIEYVFSILDFEFLPSILKTYESFDSYSTSFTPISYTKINNNLYLQNLYLGPTRSFKDIALSPFGDIISTLAKKYNRKYLILSATSGDTGPATLEALKNRENIYSICIYPYMHPSLIQKLQMTTIESKNIKSIGIDGSFDNAQTILKELLLDSSFKSFLESKNIYLSVANSINFGRIIFQIIYHIYSYIYFLKNKTINLDSNVNIIIPSGNFGNALAAFFAKKMGANFNKIIISTNSNCILHELITTGIYDLNNRKLIKTSSPAMDILKSSNVERVLFHLFGASRTKELMHNLDTFNKYQLSNEELSILQNYFSSNSSDDKEVSDLIAFYAKKGIIIEPHTATGLLSIKEGAFNIVCATAEWSKFAPSISRALKLNLNNLDSIHYIANKFNLQIHKNIQNLMLEYEANDFILEPLELRENIIEWVSSVL